MPKSLIHDWSKAAVAAFWKAASIGSRRLDVRGGMESALAVDAPILAPVFAALWAEALTEDHMPPILVRVTQGEQSMVVHVNREFLFKALSLAPGTFEPEKEEPESHVIQPA